LVVVALLVALVFAAFARVDKVDALARYDGRPAATPGKDILIVGSDSREGLTREQRRTYGTGSTAGRRTDTIMLLHVPRGGGRPVLVGLPRDSYVEIPGRGAGKLNSAYSLGGPRLLARTVEQATRIRVDDYVEVGFGGFVGIVDAVGGVRLCPKRAIQDRRANLDVRKGCQQMDGPTALGYVRARYFDPKGDLGRIERQQEFLGALSDRATSLAVLANPLRLPRAALAGGDALTVDERTSPVDLVRFGLAMGKVGGSGGQRTTVPVAGTANRAGAGNVVLWDDAAAEKLFTALRKDRRVPTSVLRGR
ncbi:MAG: LCP family protein, partial [Actinomycetota bacterium]|nr:LCP family protein [Actinomycetota bacterium]